ncbi:MAG: hypothetical protein NT105_01320 [Verrucomicrobia bacterium]|nr:hypothetical protein [Verrucomicrobiota bacterium]
MNLELVRNLRAHGNLGYVCGPVPSEAWASWFRFEDPRLRRAEDGLGLWRLTDSSTAIDAAVEVSPVIAEDVFGRARIGRRDIGAEEFSKDPVKRGPLTSIDVGPDAP